MTLRHLTTLLVLTAASAHADDTLTAAPVAALSDPDTRVRGGPRVELWAEPVPMSAAAAYLAASHAEFIQPLYLPLGVTWRASPGAQTWGVELAPYVMHDAVGSERLSGLRVSAGPVFGAGPGERGFFAQPLGTLFVTREADDLDTVPVHHGVGLEAGVDVGYRFQLGPLSVTPLVGLSAGVGLGMRRHEGGVLRASQDVAADGNSSDSAVLLVNANLDLLRVGWTF